MTQEHIDFLNKLNHIRDKVKSINKDVTVNADTVNKEIYVYFPGKLFTITTDSDKKDMNSYISDLKKIYTEVYKGGENIWPKPKDQI